MAAWRASTRCRALQWQTVLNAVCKQKYINRSFSSGWSPAVDLICSHHRYSCQSTSVLLSSSFTYRFLLSSKRYHNWTHFHTASLFQVHFNASVHVSRFSSSDSKTTAETLVIPASDTGQNELKLMMGKRAARRTKLKDSKALGRELWYSVNAFATAEEYNLEALTQNVANCGYTIQKLPEDAFDALQIEAKDLISDEPKRIFFFREGSIVFWNVPFQEQLSWLNRIAAYQSGAYVMAIVREQQDQLDFTYTEDRTQLIKGYIQLQQAATEVDKLAAQLDMYAFSNALSVSVKLAIWEAMLTDYVDSIESVLQDLKQGKAIRMSEADVLRKAGELFTLSHLINLSSDLLDTPDFYWDRDQLGRLYNKTCNYLNIPRRTRVMNEKLGQCLELVELLRDHLKDKHHTRLELMIIALIAIEVGFAVFHLVEKYYWRNDDAQLASR